MHGRWSGLLLVPLSVGCLLASPAAAQLRADCPGGLAPQGMVVALDGDVSGRTLAGAPFDISVGTVLCPLDEITTGSRSRVEFRLAGKDTTTGSSSNAVTVIPAPDSDCVTLLGGIMALISSVRGSHCVRTPFIDAGIEGTEAIAAVDPATGDSFVLVRSGQVRVVDRRAPAERLLLEAGPVDGRVDGKAAAFATAAQHLTPASPENVPAKFRDLLLDPDGATDWAIYYPPILLGAGIADPAVREAAGLLDAGEPARADALLAGAQLEGEAAAAALALRAMAAIARNRAAEGGALADEAVARAPTLGAAYVARSYALQSEGRLDAAVQAAEAAVAAAPGDAYAWARLAELQLTLGAHRPARGAVERSLGIAETALGRTIEGFAELASNRFDAAKAAFARAIAIDSEAPLPRLGLGLAAIRQGRVAEGRLEIEAAVALDPRRASLRTWLGRAYFEEDRPEKAATQFAIAQERDPDDPNAYLFSALERFQANDPIGALRQLETAEERGDRRAVVRSEAGLGEDRAVRSAAIGRVYDVLGFERLLRITGGTAVDEDPVNPEARRLLADAARADPAAEITQVSEYWKSTLLAPPSKTPIQPQLGAIDLGLLRTTGPARVTFAEFAPLFDSEGVRVDLSGLGGTQSTFGYEASATALVDNVSIGLGGFLYDTDGYFGNNDLRNEVYTARAKFQPVPELTLTTEFGRQVTEGGDRRLSLAPFLPRGDNLRIHSVNDQARLGLNYRPSDSLSVLAYAEVATIARRLSQSVSGVTQDFSGDDDGAKIEAAVFADLGPADVQIGAEYLSFETDADLVLAFQPLPPFPPMPLDGSTDMARVYAYVDAEFPLRFHWSVGGALEHMEEEGFQAVSLTEWQPRVALRVTPLDKVEIRGAYTESLARPAIFPETLDRTTLASFGQFFDNAQGIEYRVASGALDLRPASWLRAGIEGRSFDIVFPARGGLGERTVDASEIGGYVSAIFFDSVALSFEPSYESVKAPPATIEVRNLDTLMLPVGASYFHPSGAFGSAKLSYFDQDGTDPQGAFSDSGFVLDAVLGFRFPNGRGVVSLQALNVFDADVLLVDSTQTVEFGNFEDTLLLTPLFAPDRTILATLTLNF